jgi:hypothetical protein
MKIVCVRIGDRYGPEYEEYLESKLPQHEFIWVREPMSPDIMLQWNKMFAMTIKSDEPIVAMDIDLLLIGDYNKIFDYPIERGQFLSIKSWWRELSEEEAKRFTINGGFYKYYPEDVQYIYEKFMADPLKWQNKYIEEGWTTGPVNGEQHFIEDSVKEKLELVYLPTEWVTRMDARENRDARKLVMYLNRKYKKVTGNPYVFLGNKFHPDVKMVHFTNMDNHPHKWEKYHLLK